MFLSTSLRLTAVVLLSSSAAFAQSGKTELNLGTPTKPSDVTRFAPPANDNFANALAFTSAGQLLSTTIEATPETGEPVVTCATDDSNQSVWFKFTSADGTPITLDTAGSLVAPPGTAGQFTDTIMSVYTGTAIGSLTQIACNDDDPTNPTGGGDFTSRIANLAVTAGTTYYVRVSSYGNAGISTRYNGEARLTLTGNVSAPAGASLSVNPTTINFGSVTTGQTGTAQTVTLTNTGTTALTIASITGSGAPFTVDQTGTDLTLDPNQSTSFTVNFAPTASGAASGTITITSDAPGSPATITLSGTGATQGGSATTFPSTGGSVAIPDNAPTAGIVSTITVPAGDLSIADIDIDLNITHSWVGDLGVTVAHSGTSVVLVDRPGRAAGATSGFGCAGNNMDIIVDDEGTTGVIETGCTNVDASEAYTADGRYTPLNLLSAFDNTQAAGDWTLTVTDAAAGDTGSLVSWALVISPNTAGEGSAAASASRLSVAPNPVMGNGQITLTVGTAQDVRVALYDALGREVRVLFERSVTAGQQALIGFNTQGLPAGVYVVRASGADLGLTQRVTVVR